MCCSQKPRQEAELALERRKRMEVVARWKRMEAAARGKPMEVAARRKRMEVAARQKRSEVVARPLLKACTMNSGFETKSHRRSK